MYAFPRPCNAVKPSAGSAISAARPPRDCWRVFRRSTESRGVQVAAGYAYAEANTDSASLNSDADDYYTILGVVCGVLFCIPETLMSTTGRQDQFYTVCLQSSTATDKQIKKAYHSAIRQCHPDLVVEAEGSTFAIVLNDIYEVIRLHSPSAMWNSGHNEAAAADCHAASMQTLSDPDKRAAYDNIFGFDEDAINPFKDSAESRDQVA